MSGSVIRGTVVHGKGLGRELGFPTANIAVRTVDIRTGVYEARVEVGREAHRAIAFVGEGVLEAHIFDFDDDIYGREIEVELVRFVRPRQKFSSTDELKKQIKRDIDGL